MKHINATMKSVKVLFEAGETSFTVSNKVTGQTVVVNRVKTSGPKAWKMQCQKLDRTVSKLQSGTDTATYIVGNEVQTAQPGSPLAGLTTAEMQFTM